MSYTPEENAADNVIDGAIVVGTVYTDGTCFIEDGTTIHVDPDYFVERGT